jgi:hypothetical protein
MPDEDRPAELLPDFFGSGGGVTFRTTGGTAGAGLGEDPALGNELAGMPIAEPEEPEAVCGDDCQSGGGVTATKLWHFGHSTICPTTDGSWTLRRARQVVHWMTNESTSRLSSVDLPEAGLDCEPQKAPAVHPTHFFSISGGSLSPRLAAAARVVMKMIGSPPAGGGLTTYTSLPSEFASLRILRRISPAG